MAQEIKTVGELKQALSQYSDETRFANLSSGGSGQQQQGGQSGGVSPQDVSLSLMQQGDRLSIGLDAQGDTRAGQT